MKPFEIEVLEKSIEQKGNMLKGCYDDDLFKSWSGDLQKRFPNGNWKTVNGARVFMNGSKVVAGLDGFNGEIDKFFENKGKKESKKETKQEFFNLPDIKTNKDLNNNISKILSQYGSRDMASIQVEDYLNENKDIAKEWLQGKGIKTREELKNYLKNRQVKDRKEIVTSKKEEAKKWEELKTEGHVNAIMAMAKEQVAAMDEAIKKQEQEDNQKQSPKSEGKGQDTTKEEKGEFINKSKTDKFIVIGDYIYKNSDLKDGVDYKEQRGSLVENKESNRHTVKGVEYSGNGKPEDAIKLMETIDSIKLPEKSPQSQMLDLALNDLKIPIPEYKNSVALSGSQSKVPEYWHGGLNNFKEDTREFLSQLPKLNEAVSDKLIESWYYQTVISKIKGHDSPDSMGIFVKDSNVEDAVKYFSKNK